MARRLGAGECMSSRRVERMAVMASSCAGAVQDGGGHDGAMFGERERREARATGLLGTGRKMRPVQGFCLLGGEAEHEILRKPPGVALDLFVQALGGDAVERGQVCVEDDAFWKMNTDARWTTGLWLLVLLVTSAMQLIGCSAST